MQSTETNEPPIENIIQGPPQLPPLFKGQKIQSGPYIITVTDDMVAQRERQNQELYRAWLHEQRRREMGDEEEYMGDFKDLKVRRSFIRKIFCILGMQLLFTTAVVAFFIFVPAAQEFMLVNWFLWLLALIIFTVTYCAIAFSDCARRQAPNNYLCLCLLTMAMSYLAAFVSVFYALEVVLVALAMTSIVTITLSFIATFTKFDLTMRTGLITIIGLVGIVALFAMVIVSMFMYIKTLHLMIAIIGTLLISMYLFFDVQTIMGGRRIELNPDEVVYATTQIYVDIILLYQYILLLVGLFHDG
ncbi:protein lifeguard 3-like isoform X1 [Vespula pensylvanica]|uniref:protein lifeguard 3-like isoform X1 n=1 Tax=Vespula pensylvanica TaxID=30213 RepID=UPI001CBA4BC8|nr:protein lifeguard 3-like isoform X1 [Vespula pensylvanica]